MLSSHYLNNCFSTLYEEGHATVPNLAEKLTLELVHHIEVTSCCIASTVYVTTCNSGVKVFFFG